MKDYIVEGNLVKVTLDNGKTVKIATKWVQNTMEKLQTTEEDVILMWLEDNDYLINEEQEELDKEAKGKVKVIAKTEPKKKTQKERVQKENPTKELIIKTIAEALQTLDTSNVTIENKGKIITFSMNGEDFKVDLTQKRKPKV